MVMNVDRRHTGSIVCVSFTTNLLRAGDRWKMGYSCTLRTWKARWLFRIHQILGPITSSEESELGMLCFGYKNLPNLAMPQIFRQTKNEKYDINNGMGGILIFGVLEMLGIYLAW